MRRMARWVMGIESPEVSPEGAWPLGPPSPTRPNAASTTPLWTLTPIAYAVRTAPDNSLPAAFVTSSSAAGPGAFEGATSDTIWRVANRDIASEKRPTDFARSPVVCMMPVATLDCCVVSDMVFVSS